MTGSLPVQRDGPCGRPGPGAEPAPGGRAVSWIVGVILIGTTTTAAVTLQPAFRHWYLVPVSLCGILIVPDAVDWARGRLDIFDPQALVGLMGTYFFYGAPVLHVVLDYWAKYVDGPADWRDALGRMAVLNLLGLIVYRGVLAPRITTSRKPLPPTDDRCLVRLAAAIAVIGALGFVGLVSRLGGPLSYLGTVADDRESLKGLGYAQLIATAFPAALLVLVLVRYRSSLRRHPATLVPILAVYVAAELLVGGLDGSRSHTVWCLLIGVGLCHLLITPIRRASLAVLAVLLVAFMYFYGFYKSGGTQALQAIGQGASLSDLSSSTGRDMRSVLLGDFGRADIQALLLDRVSQDHAPLAHGLTYIGDVTFLVPDSLGLGHIPNKVDVGTNLMYGNGTHTPDFQSSYVYGLAGEAILNFGPAGAVVAFLPFGLLLRAAASFYRRCLASPHAPGIALLAPAISLGVALVLTSDVDNVVWFVLNYVFYAVVLAVASRSARQVRRGVEQRDLRSPIRLPGARLSAPDDGTQVALRTDR
jgi:hypothetical protein